MLNTIQFPFKLADGEGKEYKRKRVKKKKLMMNVEWEQNVAKTSRENQELMKKGKLNCCSIWVLKEL